MASSGLSFAPTILRKIAAIAREAGIRQIGGAVAPDHPFVAMARPYGLEIRSTYTRKSGCMGLALAPARIRKASS